MRDPKSVKYAPKENDKGYEGGLKAKIDTRRLVEAKQTLEKGHIRLSEVSCLREGKIEGQCPLGNHLIV